MEIINIKNLNQNKFTEINYDVFFLENQNTVVYFATPFSYGTLGKFANAFLFLNILISL